MIKGIKTLVVNAWNFIFDHRVSPLRHIPDVAVRHYILQVLGLMWAVSCSVAIGSYTFLAASILFFRNGLTSWRGESGRNG